MFQDRFESVLDLIASRDDIVLTFDDGNDTDVSVVLPALLKRGLTAKFFISAGKLGQAGYLQPSEVKTLAEAGMTIGTHGVQHVSWRQLSREELIYEIEHSRDVLQELAARAVTEAAMPSGQYNQRVLGILRRAGFRRTYTVDGPWARASDWLQPRFPASCLDTSETIRRALRVPRYGLDGAVRAGKRWMKRYRWW